MTLYLKLRKGMAAPSAKTGEKRDYKNRGSEKGGAYVMRIITGKDKDGSPQYRYFHTQEEVEAYKQQQGTGKVTHEDQLSDSEDKKKQLLLQAKKKKKSDDKKDKDDAPSISKSKSLVVRKEKK